MVSRTGWGFCWQFPTFLLLLLSSAVAAEGEPKEVARETREFKLVLNGTERGKASMKISVREDGTEIMQGEAALEVNYIVYKYVYASAGWEIWKDGKLVKVRNVSNYNGEKYSFRGALDGENLLCDVNGKELKADAKVWATSYWRLPSAEKEKRTVSLLDTDLGKKMSGEMRFVGTEKVPHGESEIESSHFKITGDVTVDLWFDASNRLVRSESIEMGQKTVAELMKISN